VTPASARLQRRQAGPRIRRCTLTCRRVRASGCSRAPGACAGAGLWTLFWVCNTVAALALATIGQAIATDRAASGLLAPGCAGFRVWFLWLDDSRVTQPFAVTEGRTGDNLAICQES